MFARTCHGVKITPWRMYSINQLFIQQNKTSTCARVPVLEA